MKKALSAVILILAIVGCGTEAPFDAEFNAPGDQDVTLYGVSATTPYAFVGPLVFQLLNKPGDKPVPGVDIEFYSDGTLSDINGNSIGTILTTGGTYYKTETNDQGVAQVFVYGTFPACGTEDIAYTTTVQAVTSAASASWTGTVTVAAC